MIDPATISIIISIIASLAATASSVGNTAKTVVETLEKKRGNGWKPNAESAKVLEYISSMMGRSFPVFDGRNYKIWSLKMKNLLISCDLWDLVEEGYKEKGRNDKASKKDREKDSLIFVIILLAVNESVSRCVVNAKNSKEAWEAIKTQYEDDIFAESNEFSKPFGGKGGGGRSGGTFFSPGEEPTSSRCNPRSADDIFAEFFEFSKTFGVMGGGGSSGGTFFSPGEEPTSSRVNPRSADDIFAEFFEFSKTFGVMGGGGRSGGTFFSPGEEPTSSRFNPRSADDIFAEFFKFSKTFGGMGGGGRSGGTFFSPGEEPTSSRFNSRSADDIFAEFFGSSRPFRGMGDGGPGMRDGRFGSTFGDHMFSSFGEGGGGSMHQSANRKAPPIEQALPCSLEDLYKGTTKKFKVNREIIDGSGKTMPVEEILAINIKPGWKKGTKITFLEKGNEHPGIKPADIVFIIDEKPHKLFTRDGNDLVATQKITLVEALTGGYTVHLTTLDGRNLTIPINTTIHPNYEEVVPREGMPIPKDSSKKGNLRIKFDIKFPTIRLTPSQKAGIKQLL